MTNDYIDFVPALPSVSGAIASVPMLQPVNDTMLRDVLSVNGVPLSVMFLQKNVRHASKPAQRFKWEKRRKFARGTQEEPSIRGRMKRAMYEAGLEAYAAQRKIEKAFQSRWMTWRDVENALNERSKSFKDIISLAGEYGLVKYDGKMAQAPAVAA